MGKNIIFPSIDINGCNNEINIVIVNNDVSVNKKSPKRKKKKYSFWKTLGKLIHSLVVVIVSFLNSVTARGKTNAIVPG